MRVRMLIAGLSVALGCAACGFKGPLYLPGRSTTVVAPAAAGAGPALNHPRDPAKPKHKGGQASAAHGGARPN